MPGAHRHLALSTAMFDECDAKNENRTVGSKPDEAKVSISTAINHHCAEV
jgi:hypothetical protein